MTAHWVPESPTLPVYHTAGMESTLASDNVIEYVEEPRTRPKKFAVVESSFEMWKLRKAGTASDQKPNWRTASKDKMPIASDTVSKKLKKQLKQKNSGIQAYQSLSSIKQLLIDFLVQDRNAAEDHPYVEWNCEHVDVPDAKAKSDDKHVMYAYLQRHDTRRQSTEKEAKPTSKSTPSNIIDISVRLDQLKVDEKPRKATGKGRVSAKEDDKQSYQQENTGSPTVPVWGPYDQFSVSQGQDFTSSQDAPTAPAPPILTPSGQASTPYFTQSYSEPAINKQPCARPITETWSHGNRQTPNDHFSHLRTPIGPDMPENTFSQSYFPEGPWVNPGQIRAEAGRSTSVHGLPPVVPGENPMNSVPYEAPQHGLGMSPPLTPWQGRPFDTGPKFDPNRPLDWASTQRRWNAYPSPATDTSSEVWSNVTSGKPSTAPTSVSEASREKASTDDLSSKDPHGRRYYHPESSGSSRYHNSGHGEGRPMVQEPANTKQRSADHCNQPYRESQRRAVSPRVHQGYSRHLSPARRDYDRREDGYRGRSPSSSPEPRSRTYHTRHRRDYSPTPVERSGRHDDRHRSRERRSEAYNRRNTYEKSSSPPRRDHTERDFDRRSRRDHSPRYSGHEDRKTEPAQSAEVVEKLARAFRRMEEEAERERQEATEREYRAKVREEVMAEIYAKRAPGPNGGFRP